MQFLAVIALAVVVEGITEYFKLSIPALKEKSWIPLVITLVLGIAGALAFNADVFAILGVEERVPIIGQVFTGILCARGSNYIYDLIGKFSEHKG